MRETALEAVEEKKKREEQDEQQQKKALLAVAALLAAGACCVLTLVAVLMLAPSSPRGIGVSVTPISDPDTMPTSLVCNVTLLLFGAYEGVTATPQSKINEWP